MNFTIDAVCERTFRERLSKLNKRLAKYGEEIKIVSMVTREKKVQDEYTGFDHFYNVIDIETSDPEVLGKSGVTYIGTISFKDGIKTIYSEDDSVVLGDIEDDKLTCDHCGINRYRVKYFVFKDENGEVKIIGSTCVQEWFGLDPRVLNVWSSLQKDAMTGEFESGYGFRQSNLIDLSSVILYTAHATRMFEDYWTSIAKAEEWGKISTSSDIWSIHSTLMSNSYSKGVQDAKADFRRFCDDLPRDFIEKQKQLLINTWGNLEPENDFHWNILNNLFISENGENILRDYTKAIGIIGWSIWKANFTPPEKEEKTDKKESEYVGEIKKREVFTLTVTFVKEVESFYGWSTLIKFEDENGNVFITFYSGRDEVPEEGNTYKIKATVKAHKEYKGEKQTVINRMTVVEEVE